MMTATNSSVSKQKHDDNNGILVSAEGSALSDQEANPFVSVSNRLPEKVSVFVCDQDSNPLLLILMLRRIFASPYAHTITSNS